MITLKQGLGRLIRSTDDRGVLSILDSRILTKEYGKLFLQSLSPAPVVHRREEIRRCLSEDLFIRAINHDFGSFLHYCVHCREGD